MAGSSSDSVKTNVVGGVITAGLLAIAGGVWAFAPNAWKWFIDPMSSIWAHLSSAASVPMWWLYVLYAISAGAVISVGLRVRAGAKSEPTFIDYTEDRYLGAVWRWRYGQGGPTGAWAFCPRCDTVLVYSYRHDYGAKTTTIHCETCNLDIATEPGDKDDLVGKVNRQIDRKIRTGEWKVLVERKEAL